MSVIDRIRPEIRALSAYGVPADAAPIKLDANESPWSFSHALKEKIANAVGRIAFERYPDPRATALRAAIAKRYDAHPDELVIGSGSDEVISLLCSSFTNPSLGAATACVLIPDPSFVMFAITARSHGLTPIMVPLRADASLDVDAMLAAISKHSPSIIFLATPNNPTGNSFARADVKRIIAGAPTSLVVIDEAYGEFASESLRDLFTENGNVAMLGTLSKVGLAALRVGWARLPKPLAVEVDKARQPFNLNALSQVAATIVLDDTDGELDAHVRTIRSERERMREALAPFTNLAIFPSDSNFFFARVSDGSDALTNALKARGIAIRNFHKHGGYLANSVRITVGTPGENDALIEALKAL